MSDFVPIPAVVVRSALRDYVQARVSGRGNSSYTKSGLGMPEPQPSNPLSTFGGLPEGFAIKKRAAVTDSPDGFGFYNPSILGRVYQNNTPSGKYTFDLASGKMRPKTYPETNIGSQITDPVGNALYNSGKTVDTPNSLGYTLGNGLRRLQGSWPVQGLGNVMFNNGKIFGGLSGGGAGYGIGKLVDWARGADEGSWLPSILGLLGAGYGAYNSHLNGNSWLPSFAGGTTKSAAYKDFYGKDAVIRQIFEAVGREISSSQKSKIMSNLNSRSSFELSSIMQAIQALPAAAAAGVLLKLLGLSNLGAFTGAAMLGAFMAYPKQDVNTAGNPVIRYKL